VFLALSPVPRNFVRVHSLRMIVDEWVEAKR